MPGQVFVAFDARGPTLLLQPSGHVLDIRRPLDQMLLQPSRNGASSKRMVCGEIIIARAGIRTHRSSDDDLRSRDATGFLDDLGAKPPWDVLQGVHDEDYVDRRIPERQCGCGASASDEMTVRGGRKSDLQAETRAFQVRGDAVTARSDLEEGASIARQAFEQRGVTDELVDHDPWQRIGGPSARRLTMMGVRVAVVSHAAVLGVNAEPFAALAECGAEVTLIVPESLKTDLRGTVTLERLPGFGGKMIPLRVHLGGYRKILGGQRGIHVITYRGLGKALDACKPQVVFVEEEPYSFAAGQVARWCRSRRIPFVVHQNQNLPRSLPLPFEKIRRLVISRAAGCTVRNEDAAVRLREHGFDGPIAYFPHAIDPARYAVSPADPELPRPVVGFVGRLVPEKGILDLVDALAALRRASGDQASSRASLLVVGDGAMRAEAETRAKAANVPARFIGAVEHDTVPRWYPAMDVVVVPSRSTETWTEQFGRVPIEANAAGTPVVVSDGGELPATVQATGGGLVYALSDPRALDAALARILDDPALRGRLSAAGLAGVHEKFTHLAVASRLYGLLSEVKAVRS